MGFGLFKIVALIAVVSLAVSLLLNGYLYRKLTEQTSTQGHNSTFFSYVFAPTMQNLTARNLYLNLTFDVVGGNLTVKAEINADSYNPNAVLALQFDSDNNGTIDIRYYAQEDLYLYDFRRDDSQFLLRTNNYTTASIDSYWGWLPDGTIYFSRALPSTYPRLIKSPFHYCTYNQTKGLYTFFFTFPSKPASFDMEYPYGWLDGEYGTLATLHGILGKLVRVLYTIEPTSNEESPEKGLSAYIPPFDFAK